MFCLFAVLLISDFVAASSDVLERQQSEKLEAKNEKADRGGRVFGEPGSRKRMLIGPLKAKFFGC